MQREKLYKKKQKQQSGVGFRSNSWLFGVEKKQHDDWLYDCFRITLYS